MLYLGPTLTLFNTTRNYIQHCDDYAQVKFWTLKRQVWFIPSHASCGCLIWALGGKLVLSWWDSTVLASVGFWLTLYMLNFSAEPIICIYNFYIPPHWQDIGSWNPSSCKTRTCLFHTANIMAADDLATQGARTSAAMILTKLNRDNLVPTH